MWLVLGAAALVAGWAASAVSLGDTASEQTQTRAFASEVNLRAADVPGFKFISTTEREQEAFPGPLPLRVEECDGGPVVGRDSHGIGSGLALKEAPPIEITDSLVYPMHDPSSALAYIAAADSLRGLRCLQRDETRRHELAGLPGVRRRIEAVALRSPLGGSSVAGVRVWSCSPGPHPCKSRRVRSFTDRIWFATGPYVVALVFDVGVRNLANGPAPVALPDERRLVALLLGRAEGQPVTVTELIAAVEAHLGQQVTWTVQQHGRITTTCHGVLSTGLGRTTDPVPDQLGRVGFWVPYPSCGFFLDPRVLTEARERPDGRTLRVEMYGGPSFLIEAAESAT